MMTNERLVQIKQLVGTGTEISLDEAVEECLAEIETLTGENEALKANTGGGVAVCFKHAREAEYQAGKPCLVCRAETAEAQLAARDAEVETLKHRLCELEVGDGGPMSTIDRDALLAWVRRWQSVREDMAKADHCDHAFNQSEADHFAALAALLEGQGWQDIATAPKDGTVILRPHRIWGAIDVRYAVEPLSVTTLTAGTKWEWLNGDYTTAWPDDAFLPFWQRLPPAPTEAAFPADLFDVETFERIAAFMGDTKR